MAVKVINQEIDDISQAELSKKIDRAISNRQYLSIATVNPEFIVRSTRDARFAHALARFSLRLADGFGLVLMTRLMSKSSIKHRVTGADLIIKNLIPLAARKGYRILFFGSTPQGATLATQILIKRHPDLHFTCVSGGKIDNPEKVTPAVINNLKAFKPDILLVNLGALKQEYFILRYQKEIGAPVAIGCGGTLDFIAGTASRAPSPIRAIGLEWLWRLVTQPRRLGRILNATVTFPCLYLRWRLGALKMPQGY